MGKGQWRRPRIGGGLLLEQDLALVQDSHQPATTGIEKRSRDLLPTFAVEGYEADDAVWANGLGQELALWSPLLPKDESGSVRAQGRMTDVEDPITTVERCSAVPRMRRGTLTD